MSKSARSILDFLAAGTARLHAHTDAGRALLVLPAGVQMSVELGELRAMVEDGRLVRSGAGVALRSGEAVSTNEAAVIETPTINDAESPLALLAKRRTRDGSSFLSHREVNAGERLRTDYTRANIMPRLGANWETPISRGRRAAGGSAADLTDAMLAARQRVEKAIDAVGPELSGVLIDVCCFLKGLERVEAERGWPVRSAKVVLKTALGALGRHYFPETGRERRPLLHWGADDYRPRMACQP